MRYKEIVSTQQIIDTEDNITYDGLIDGKLLDKINNQDALIKHLELQLQALEVRNKRQRKRLKELYALVEKKEWDKLYARFIYLNKDYEGII